MTSRTEYMRIGVSISSQTIATSIASAAKSPNCAAGTSGDTKLTKKPAASARDT